MWCLKGEGKKMIETENRKASEINLEEEGDQLLLVLHKNIKKLSSQFTSVTVTTLYQSAFTVTTLYQFIHMRI